MTGALGLPWFLAAPAVQERGYGWGWDMHPMVWMWGAGGLVMMLGMLLFWAAVIVALIVGVRWLARDASGTSEAPPPDRALQILRERYARGEIDREEFEQRKRDLG